MKNYTSDKYLDVNQGQDLGDMNGMSADLVSDWDKPMATVNISILKIMLSHIPRVGFTDMKQDLIDEIRLCGTKEEIETVVADTLDFGSIMKAIGEASDKVVDPNDMACEADLSVGKIDLDKPYRSSHPDNA